MGEQPPTPAIAAVAEEQLRLSEALNQFIAEARAHWAAEDQRFKNIDAFIDPTMELQSLLKQLFGILSRNHQAVQALERIVKEEQIITRKALALHLSTADLDRVHNS